MKATKSTAKPVFTPAPRPIEKAPHSSSAAYTKQLNSQRIASDIEQFYANGGQIEKLGVTRVVVEPKREKPARPTPTRPK